MRAAAVCMPAPPPVPVAGAAPEASRGAVRDARGDRAPCSLLLAEPLEGPEDIASFTVNFATCLATA